MSRRILASILVPFGLLLVLVIAPAAVRAGGGCHNVDGSVYTEGSTTVVKMDVCSYAPTIARVAANSEVRFLNASNIEHMVVGRSSTWGSDILQPGKEFSARFTTAGTYPFSCPLHPGMVGAIVVGDGVNGEAAAAGGVTASAIPSPAGSAVADEPNVTSAATDTTATDAAPIGIALAAGLAAGAIVGALLVGMFRGRRDETSGTLTTN